MTNFSKLLIAAPSSGSGKTTITLGLLRALKNRGLKVQPFKCGPDYIDTKFHSLAADTHSVNLDLFLSSPQHVENLFSKYSSKVDVSLVEGVMGLFDGYDKMSGSSAEVAGILEIPIILVVNAKSVAYSVAPLIYGFKNFSKNIKLVGVIFNFVGSESHYKFLQDACKDVGVESLGYFPKSVDIEIPSRYLGLSLDSESKHEEYIDKIATLVEQHIDIDRLLAITKATGYTFENDVKRPSKLDIRIAVAKDEAFNFMYHENIEKLRELGNVTFFSPLHDSSLPQSDFVYFPGGYPELYAKQLSENQKMITSIKEYAESGGKVLAECGGMMYLSSSIIDSEGNEFPMVNIFKQKATMGNMKLKLGYRQFQYNDLAIKGHEFHYSAIDSSEESITQIYNAKDAEVNTVLLRYKNVIAGYTHIYWAEGENILQLFKQSNE